MWPSHNLVVSSVSHNNADPLANDADGFAAKITAGEGNVFRHSIAFPFALTVLGLSLVYLGWIYHTKYDVIQRHVRALVPLRKPQG